MFSEFDFQMMRRAILLSRCGFPAPNPRVGCVIAKDGQIIGEGFHEYAGGLHAEANALKKAGDAAGSTVYVTLEPCNHQGRQPPCSDALIGASVERVVFAVADPNPVAIGGIERLRESGIEVASGLMEEEARRANRAFLHFYDRGRPYVFAKIARSRDGYSGRAGETVWITEETSIQRGWRLRAEAGAVLVGAETVVQDDPRLTARLDGVVNQPLRVVLDPNGRCPKESRVFSGEGEVLHIVGDGVAVPDAIEVPTDGNGRFELDRVLGLLADKGCIGVLVEGGSSTLEGFLESGRVDELHVHIGQMELGDGIRWIPEVIEADLPKPVEVRSVGSDLHEKYLL